MMQKIPEQAPTFEQTGAVAPSLEQARAMYSRCVASWVLDLARLRRDGLERPSGRRSRRPAALPIGAGARPEVDRGQVRRAA